MGVLYPRYHLFTTHRDIYLATSKKLALQKTNKYDFNLSKTESSTNEHSFFARLRSNFLGTEFMLYDNGVSPTET